MSEPFDTFDTFAVSTNLFAPWQKSKAAIEPVVYHGL